MSATPSPSIKANNTTAVRVGVRIRPLTSQELCQGGRPALQTTDSSIGIGERQFTYDAVFDSLISQAELYASIAPPLLKSVLEGYNATIMAYGQTGSGKTFTMGSEAHSQAEETTSSNSSGLIPRFMADMFAMLQRKKDASDSQKDDANNNSSPNEINNILRDFHISASFLEVYGEDVHDLLDYDRQHQHHKALPLREDSNGGVVVAGLKQRNVHTADEALQVLHEGTLNRTTAATLMNLTSSRSHAVFTVHLMQQLRQSSSTEAASNETMDTTTTSRFTFVDLAGSERMKKTGAEGERAREGIKINEGLLALGNVINALSSDKSVHVPYRQSKLTRLLQDALGGNSQTLFLACVSPSNTNASETLSTLHYANRARQIKNVPTKNVDASAMEIRRLRALTHVLQCELLKHRYHRNHSADESQEGDESNIGQMVEDSLLQRPDVVDYLQRIHSVAEKKWGVASPSNSHPAQPLPSASSMLHSVSSSNKAQSSMLSLTSPRPIKVVCSSSNLSSMMKSPPLENTSMALDTTPNRSVLDKFSDTLLEEVDPDAEMAMLDQLLELQHQDHEYDEEHKKDEASLKQMDGELAEQEALLLQLRESLKVYHSMKENYEMLVSEVQQLELEKASLAEQLERVSADPSMGCSMAIKKKLEKVEQSLARARNETRKHQQMYRKAEQEAQKCRTLERKIHELMQGRVQLMKKQNEAAIRHRHYTESKTREIMGLKRKERTADIKMSQLQTQIQMHKRNLENRNVYCTKLSEKLKQTEGHLMKLLTMRKRELDDRANVAYNSDRRSTRRWSRSFHQSQTLVESQSTQFAEATSEEVRSRNFLLEKVIAERVQHSQLKEEYSERVAAYGEVMRQMVSGVNALNNARMEQLQGSPVVDLEHNVEDLELRLELLESELELLRARIPDDDADDGESNVQQVLCTATAPVIRALLWECMNRLTEIEIESQKQKRSLELKELALQSFENEMEQLDNKIAMLTKELAKYHTLAESKIDGLQTVLKLETAKSHLESNLQSLIRERDDLLGKVESLQGALKTSDVKFSEVTEKLALAEVIASQNDGVHASRELLKQLQAIWSEVGVGTSERDLATSRIQSCLPDTCNQLLEEALATRINLESELAHKQRELDKMLTALGSSPSPANQETNSLLWQKLDCMRVRLIEVYPIYQSADERREKVLSNAKSLQIDLGLSIDELSISIQKLLHQNLKPATLYDKPSSDARREKIPSTSINATQADVAGPVTQSSSAEISGLPGCLNEAFLSQCEHDVKALRLKKSEILVANLDIQTTTWGMVEEMHMEPNDVAEVALRNLEKREEHVPSWWHPKALGAVSHAVASCNRGLLQATPSFTKHLEFVHEAIKNIAGGRRALSVALKGAVEHAQKALLDTVGGELNASEAYSSFHDALFRLPSLSQEYIYACITEMQALAAGVDAMTQSEIEALTFVWESLSINSVERGQFWNEIEQFTSKFETDVENSFDTVGRLCADVGDDWFSRMVTSAKTADGILRRRLYKLEQVHGKVEQLRIKQDRKSQIISLDSEVRILSAKLADFEDTKCSKERLLTKKAGSSTLLKEERFRKQMQSTFASKLEQLTTLLQGWESDEGENFDSRLLSEEVRSLLENSQMMESWVEKRTEFMHLRTVKSKPSVKKAADGSSAMGFPLDDQPSASSVPMSAQCTTKTSLSSPRKTQAIVPPSGLKGSSRKRYMTTTESSRRFTRSSALNKELVSINEEASDPGSALATKRKSDESNGDNPSKASKISRRDATEAATVLSPNTTRPTTRTAAKKKRGSNTLLPFGHVLSQVSVPFDRESADC